MESINQNLITVTNNDINNFNFQQALGRLRNLPLSAKAAYNIGYIGKKIDTIVKDGRVAFQKTAEKYAKLDEKGTLIPAKDENDNIIPGSFEFKDDESKVKFEEESKEFMEMKHVINRDKISVYVLGDATLSANDISALEPLFSDLDE